MRERMIRLLAMLASLYGSVALAGPPPPAAGAVDAVTLSASINQMVYALPSGCTPTLLYDLTYFKCAGVWYLPQYGPVGVSYLRVPSRSWRDWRPTDGG